MRFLLLALPIVLLASVAHAQDVEPGAPTPSSIPSLPLSRALGNAPFATTIRAGQMDASWRRVRLSGALGNEYYGDYESRGVYYTRGATVRIADEIYVAAYQPAQRDVRNLSADEYRLAQLQATRGLNANSVLALSLLRMSALNAFKDAQPFDPRTLREPVRGDAVPPAYFSVLTVRYLQKLNAAMQSYRAEFGQMPPMTNTTLVRAALLPYVENAAILTQPGTTQPFLPNPIFSGRPTAHLRKRGRSIVFYQADASADGKRAVLFYNGSVRRVDAGEWKRWAKLSSLETDGDAK